MGMSTTVVGFRPPDEKWKQMKAIWDVCKKAKVKIPQEVDDFFDGIGPDPRGIEVRLDEIATEYHEDMQEGFEIEIAKLPENITVIRFYNSW